MKGLSLSSIKKNPSLIPLFFCLGVGMTGALMYTLRLAFKNPDVTWNIKKRPEPWNDYANKQYKFYNPSGKDVPICPAPKY